MMEDKTYEAGRVEISSAEYRDLVKEATENAIDARDARRERWAAEKELDTVKKELDKANAEIESLRKELESFKAMLRGAAQTTLYNNSVIGSDKAEEMEY
jgi:predicted translin family RNA/ssDNA-binding protein